MTSGDNELPIPGLIPAGLSDLLVEIPKKGLERGIATHSSILA